MKQDIAHEHLLERLIQAYAMQDLAIYKIYIIIIIIIIINEFYKL